MRGRRPRVAYFRHDDIGVFHYGPDHPMKPLRIKMADCLVHSYKLHKRKNMAVYTIPKASPEDMMLFHEPDYVKFLKVADSLLYRSPKVKKDGMDTDDQSEDGELEEIADLKARFNMDDDCPIFAGIFEFCRISAGGSIEGARMLNEGECDIAINWSGGLHHAKRTSASGFCYVNDIVLGILELLKVHKRVLYVDIDVHHGDGVEEAFFTTDRVMTVSFHKYGDFFPHTGALNDIGFGKGLGYALNLPLKDGMDDISYANLFHPLMQRVMDTYDPGAVVLQCGADSLSQDWLGPFNLTLDGHSFCVKFFRDRGVPLLLLGGGGYTISNVARCWAYETAVAIGQEDISMDIPDTDPYIDYYDPDKKLYVDSSNRTNYNTRSYLDGLKVRFISTLNALSFRPSVQLGGSMFPYPFSAWQKPKRPGSCGKALTDEDIEMDFEKVFSSKPVKTWKDETKAKKENLIKQSWDVYFASRLPNVRIP